MKTRILTVLVLCGFLASCADRAATPESNVSLTRSDDRVRVEIDGKLFTEYLFKGYARPIFYPVLAADGTEMMRNYPMKDVDGEVRDHPHHKSLWFTHGAVNGVDFWAENERAGKIVNESVEHSVKDGAGVIVSKNKWVALDGTVHLTDETTVRLHGSGDARYLDYQVTLKAPADKPVVFGDTKEGSMAIRLPLWMTPPHSYSQTVVDAQGKSSKKRVPHDGKGTIINAEGVKNTPTWGKQSTWVDYHAPKDGKTYGVAIFDHPSNPRHPTWWHVRDYALFAANPFGKHDFEPAHKDNPKAGDLTIPAGGSTTFRWRFYFHTGDEKQAGVAEQYRLWAAGK